MEREEEVTCGEVACREAESQARKAHVLVQA